MSTSNIRRLAAIMFTDMVGYTALMQRDEKSALKKRKRHREVLETLHQSHDGEVIQYFGDGTLSVFTNSIDAVQCAIEIQQSLVSPIAVDLRIGIHAGSILVREDGIIGDAVNIASRIESFASVGSVLVSDTIWNDIKNQNEIGGVSLGQYTLKNVDQPFEIYAIVAEQLSVPNAQDVKGKGKKFALLRSDIPSPPTPLIGRERELAEVCNLLEEHRVVTITGAGGMGKTRFALEICQHLKNKFDEALAFIPLDSLTRASEVVDFIATTLDVKDVEDRSSLDGIVALIGNNRSLLVLDNLEQVIDCGSDISKLVSLCDQLSILCTSRTPLKINAEYTFELMPLALPSSAADSQTLLDFPAIKLFVDRAQKSNPDFKLDNENWRPVLEICQHMDGLPLALELAAARIRILPPDKLLRRLSRALDLLTSGSSELPGRHKTIRGTIDWSHSLLSDLERRLFRRLAIFAGGFTLEAAEQVCYLAGDDDFLAIDELESLVDKALVQSISGGVRFRMLQTIRDFAMEQLRSSDEYVDVAKAHASHFVEIAQEIEKGTMGTQQSVRMQMGLNEEANIQAALDFLLLETYEGNAESQAQGLSICGDLWMYWHIRGKHSFGKKYTSALFVAINNEKPSIPRCKALYCAHVSAFSLGEYEPSLKLAKDLYHDACALQDEFEIAKGYVALTFGYLNIEFPKALETTAKAVSILRTIDRPYWLGLALWQNGVINLINGDLGKAGKSYQEAHKIFETLEDREGIGLGVSGMALIANVSGNQVEAIRLYQKALDSFKIVGDRPEEARALSEISWIYIAQGQAVLARKYIMESIQAHSELGSNRGIGHAMTALAAIEVLENRPSQAIQIAAAAHLFAEKEGVLAGFLEEDKSKPYLEDAAGQLADQEIEMNKELGRRLTLEQVLDITTQRVEVLV